LQVSFWNAATASNLSSCYLSDSSESVFCYDRQFNRLPRYSQQLQTGTLPFGRHNNVWLCCWYSAEVVTEVLRQTPAWVVRRVVPTFRRSVMSSFSRASSPRMLLYPSRLRHVIESLAHTQLDIPEDKFDTPVQWHVYFCFSSIHPLLYNRDRHYLLYVATYRQFWQPHTISLSSIYSANNVACSNIFFSHTWLRFRHSIL